MWVSRPRLTSKLLLRIALLGLAVCLLYTIRTTFPQLAATDIQAFQVNITQQKVMNGSTVPPSAQPPLRGSIVSNKLTNFNNDNDTTQAVVVNRSSMPPPAQPLPLWAAILFDEYANLEQRDNNDTQSDVMMGVPAKVIYEPGYVDVSSWICGDLGKGIKVLIMITSAPDHESQRLAIRKTWGYFGSRIDVAIAFMLGSTSNETVNAAIKREQFLYGDLVRGKFVDSYDNLTLKTISILEWVVNYCPKAVFVLKTDDDMFINVYRLLDFIARHNPEARTIYGKLARRWKPKRGRKSKYYISRLQYGPEEFPDFTTGPAYLFPARLSEELYLAALNQTYIKLEDVFITGIVAKSLRINRKMALEFRNIKCRPSACRMQQLISIHKVKGVGQFNFWAKLHKC